MKKPWRPRDNRATVMSARMAERGAIIAAVVTVIGGIVVALLTRGSPQPATSPAAVTVPHHATCSVGTAPAGQLLGQGTLKLEGDNTSYDLDAVNCGWAPLSEHTWIKQNIQYVPIDANGKPILLIADSPASDVLMGTRGPWNYQACLNAHWDSSYGPDNPNPVTGAALKAGEGVCIHTENTKYKNDGGHYVLLVIRAVTAREVTAWVTVWY